jgi:phenylalanyl-tRNA synthetase beta chain
MIVSYQWLHDYLPQPLPVEDLSRILTSIGLEVEAVEKAEAIPGSLEGLVIGEVVSAERHPNADKLKVTKVNVGTGELLSIVCGAPNVEAGQKVIVAPVGTTVHPLSGEPFQIKKAKIRGEESQGMICAEDEIGLGTDHDGIIVLDATAPVGALAREFLNIKDADQAIHIGLTPNRSDAMSHIGVARDVAAYMSHHGAASYQAKTPVVDLPGKTDDRPVKVIVDDIDACPRYAGIGIRDIKVGPSPEWLQAKLRTIGVRSINNIVDITNFVLHEYGQPLHAFDATRLKDRTIRVGFLPEGTAFVTLDEKERKLSAADLMICDGAHGVCIAGVFGGLGSGIGNDTTEVFIESAYFNPSYVRRTSLKHGLRTDAATHFEKGVDISNVIPALKRAASLILEIAGGQIISDIIDIYPKPLEAVTIDLDPSYVRKLAGKDYSDDAIAGILTALGFTIDRSGNRMKVTVPSNKSDVTQPADLVEEVLRIDGLDNIAIPERLNISLLRSAPNDRALRNKLSETLFGEGFQEIVTNSIVNSKYYPERGDLVKMLNSLSSELDVMRPSMLESGLEVVQYNCNRKNQDLMLFEFGNVYRIAENRYDEQSQLGIWCTGNRSTTSWNQKEAKADLYFLKGVIRNLAAASGIRQAVHFYEKEEGRVSLKWKNQVLCSIEKVSAEKLTGFAVKQDVYYAVLHWSLWTQAAAKDKIKYSEVPKFPSVQRDLALVLDRQVQYREVEQATDQLKLEALQDYALFDVFESDKLGTNKKSLALSYTFQLGDRTLTEAEIEQLMQQLINTYKSKLQALIRE